MKFAIAMRKGVRLWNAFLHLGVGSGISGHLTRSLVFPFQPHIIPAFLEMQEYIVRDGENREHERQKDKEDKS